MKALELQRARPNLAPDLDLLPFRLHHGLPSPLPDPQVHLVPRSSLLPFPRPLAAGLRAWRARAKSRGARWLIARPPLPLLSYCSSLCSSSAWTVGQGPRDCCTRAACDEDVDVAERARRRFRSSSSLSLRSLTPWHSCSPHRACSLGRSTGVPASRPDGHRRSLLRRRLATRSEGWSRALCRAPRQLPLASIALLPPPSD